MRIYYLLIITFFIGLSSCSSPQGIAFEDMISYESKGGYKNLYIVDTIQIENPVWLYSNSGFRFVMSKKVFDEYDGKEEFFFNRPDVFLMEIFFPYADLPIELTRKYAPLKDCYNVLSEEKRKGVGDIYMYKKQPDYFLLLLIQGEYINNFIFGLDSDAFIPVKNSNLFYKVVIPYCEETIENSN